jgi:hypothetical protein
MNLMGELKSILLCTDCTEYSLGAVNEAINFARACGTSLTVLHVIETSLHGAKADDKLQKAQAHLDEIREEAVRQNVECKVVIEKAAEAYKAIVNESVNIRADIIIMGKHGRSAFERLLMGSVTYKVIAGASCKVLVVPKDAEIKGENIVLAVDGSGFSDAAAAEALNMVLACPFVKNFLVVHAYPHRDRKMEAEALLGKIRATAEGKGIQLETLAIEDDPYKAITNLSFERGTDIIIMGTHGRTGIAKLIIGSTAESVISLSKCAVLVTRSR